MTDTQEPNPSLCLEMAHVLFTDIVAYSQLPMDEQTRLVSKLQQIVRSTTEFARAQKRHQLLRLPTGDGMALVFFGNAEAPVRCAIEISRALRDNSELKLRMGVHTGPVQRVEDINANRNVAGGGINIAQRVMDCGDAGHILVSSTHAEVIGNVSSWSPMLHDLGEAEVKHGVRVHLYNLYNEEAGNPELPKKISAQRAAPSETATKVRKKDLLSIVIGGVAALALALVGGWLFYAHKAHALSATDTIVLADFTNTTGDSVFDGTLRQGLTVQLEQSPFLGLVSERRIQQTLPLMGQPPDARLTPDIARDLCQRTQSAAVVDGSIASLGSQFVLGLKVVNCHTGDSLAQEQVTADGKERVLKALGEAAAKLRGKLGESLSTVRKFDTPLEQATTPSLEALQAYSLGWKTMTGKGDYAAAVPLFQRAVRLDPKFAMAHASLGTSYQNLSETNHAAENTRKAYELRERTSDWEKFYIESHYHHFVTGDLERARQTYELWAQTYPRDDVPPYNLGVIYQQLGQHDKTLEKFQETLRLDPASGDNYGSLADSYLVLNRLEEARATVEEAQAKKLDSPRLRFDLYFLAFLHNDAAGMAQQVAWSAGKPGLEDVLLGFDADTAAYSGRLGKARGFSRQAMASAERAEETETAAGYEAEAALWEALFGNAAEARQRAAAALGLSTGRDVQYGAGLALAFAGDAARAQTLADDLAKRFPEDTFVQFNYLPTMHAQLSLNHDDTARAIETLQAAAPYELGNVDYGALYPVYVRGGAYLAEHQGSEAAAEFQKILDHRGIVVNDPIGAIAHLGLARAYVLQGDTEKARAAYQDFLTLWKDADPDIPIFKQAKAEYARLR